MDIVQKTSTFLKKTVAGLAVITCCLRPAAADIAVALSGKVVDSQGLGVAGARVELAESQLSAISDAQGGFSLAGSVANGVIRRAALPGGAYLDNRGGRLRLFNPGLSVNVIIVTSDGKIRSMVFGKERRGEIDLDAGLGRRSGVSFIRVESGAGRRTYRYARAGAGALLIAGAQDAPPAASAKTAAEAQRFLLKVSAAGYLDKIFAENQPQDSNLSLGILSASATLKQRIQDFLGAGKTFRLAFLKKDLVSGGKPVLNYVDFSEMAGDTMPAHAFADSRMTDQTEAFAPSWSPDGRYIAYEAGRENFTFPTSRVYIQPLQGARFDGPANSATNPRWFAEAGDTSLIWCTSGGLRGWSDTAGATYKQKFSAGQLAGGKVLVTKGSYNAGLSTDGRYLATAFPWGVMLDLQTAERRFFHLYPEITVKGTDSVQVCNASVSQDPAHPSRMLFLDFGVPDGAPAYPNPVRPQHYVQHRMILIGDYLSGAPGRIVDFIDTPAQELAGKKTWDDPEWSNQADFAVATTRDPNGDLSDPLTPRQTQPDIYLIKLSTKESIKIFTGVNQTLPVVWIGP
jgi:hypothetical protein